MSVAKCKICRRAGQKLFLKGERCFSPKCAIVRRNYPPGVHGQKRRRAPSEFGQQLLEKQKIQHAYFLSEQQLSSYVKDSLRRSREGTLGQVSLPDFIATQLESRLDSATFRFGFAFSRSVARHLTTHGHFQVNGRRVDIPSYALSRGDKITIRPESMRLAPFVNLSLTLKKAAPPTWLSLDKEKFIGEVIGAPTAQETALPGDLSMVIEYYSR